MITSADARPGTVRRCKRSAGHRTVPGRFYAIFQMQWWIHLYQNLPSFLQRNRLLKWKRLRLTLTVMVMETTLAQDRKKINSTCCCMLIILSCSSEIYIFVFMFWVFRSVCTSAKTRRFSPVAVRLIKHRPVPGRASAALLRDFCNVLGACQTSYDVRPGTVRCPVGHRWNRTIKSLNKNRPVPVRCVPTPAGRRQGTVRCPTDVILPSMTLPNAVRAPWNFK